MLYWGIKRFFCNNRRYKGVVMKKGMPCNIPKRCKQQLLVAYQEREVFRPFRVYTLSVLYDVTAKYACHAAFVLHLTFHN